MADDRIQLILDLGASGKNAAEVRLELERLNAAAKSVGDTYEVLAVSGHGYELGEERITIAQKRATQAMEEAAAEAKRLALEEQRLADEAIDKVTRAAIEQTQAQKAMSLILAESTTRTNTAVVATAKLTPESRAAAKAQAEMGRGILQTSYAVQDFTSQLGSRGLVGGLAAVQNNIPGILAGIGAGAGLAGVLSLASVGVGILIENWEKLGLAFKNANIEAQAAEIDRVAKASAEATKAIDAQIDALRKAETAGKPEQAEIVKAAIGEAGGVDDVTNATRAAMLAESPEVAAATKNANATADANATAAANPANPIAQLKALVAIRKADRERDEATAKVEQLTKALVAKAGQGDADAIRELDRLNPGGSFGQALPESIKAQDAEVQAVDDQGAAMHKAGVKRRKNDALVDTLNTEGAANEAATRKDEFEANRKSLLLPQNDVAESTPEYQANQARAEIQRGQANLGDLQRQADDIAGRMQVGAAMGFDVGPLQQTLQNIAAMYEQQQRAFVNAQLKINDLARGSRVSQRTVRSNLNRNRP